jgi:pimeloyl-ACP methyl ester carboxylesterase
MKMLLAAILAAAIPLAAHATDGPKPRNRAEATAVIRELRRIVTPEGIESARTVRIGGIEQFITIRGTDRRNPVLLILHGGPGFAEAPLGWWNTHALEEYFVVVQWDQRGAGKTYLINDPKAVAPTMTPERFIDDVGEMTAYLRRDLGKQKIFLLGHSWGSYIGLEFARRHPEWLHAYIGTGQATDVPESERRGYAFALAAARKAGNAEAVADLESIAPYAQPGEPIPLKSVALERKWSDFFGGVMAWRTGQTDDEAAQLSPDYTDEEAPHIYDGNGYSEKFLFAPVLSLDLSGDTTFACPIILLEGRHDRTVNSEVAYEWFKTVKAPEKRFVWFEHAAHEVMTEEPGRFLVTMVEQVRPIAAKAGDIAPSPQTKRDGGN